MVMDIGTNILRALYEPSLQPVRPVEEVEEIRARYVQNRFGDEKNSAESRRSAKDSFARGENGVESDYKARLARAGGVRKPNADSDNSDKPENVQIARKDQKTDETEKDAPKAAPRKQTIPGVKELSDAEKKQIEKLKQNEQKVRAHEMAHLAAGAGLTIGGARYSYSTGPDGKRYITGGEVSIDMSTSSDPSATIRKMESVKRAALAPADPSPQDRSVAQSASRIQAKARQELSRQRVEEMSGDSDDSQYKIEDKGANNSEYSMKPPEVEPITDASGADDAKPHAPAKPDETRSYAQNISGENESKATRNLDDIYKFSEKATDKINENIINYMSGAGVKRLDLNFDDKIAEAAALKSTAAMSGGYSRGAYPSSESRIVNFTV